MHCIILYCIVLYCIRAPVESTLSYFRKWANIKHFIIIIIIIIITLAGAWVIIKVKGHQYWWIAGGYDLEIGQF